MTIENKLKLALAELFQTRGTSAVAERIQDEPNLFKIYIHGKTEHQINVQTHPNEDRSIEWMNLRLKNMGLPGLVFVGTKDSSLFDPTAIDNKSIRLKKWLRYVAGPGVALAATVLSLPHDRAFSFLSLLPALGVGLTSVILEIQFAWPWLNNRLWKNVFKIGGDAFSPFTMWTVNFLYALALFAAGFATSRIPTLFGGEVIPFSSPDLGHALLEALTGSLWYTLAMGQFQSDVAKEEERGSITANQRYGLETLGVVINNSARILKWVLPSLNLATYLAWGGFFLLKTFPQLVKTRISDRLSDHEFFRRIDPKHAPKPGFFEKCALRLSVIPLVNLPWMRKKLHPNE